MIDIDMSLPSKLSRVKRVAARRRARFEAGGEPTHALLRRAVRKRIGNDVALSLLLQHVVANGRCGLQCGLDIARLEELPFLLRAVCPYACKAVRLQFDTHLDLVGLGPTHAALHLLHLWQDANDVLHMVTDLVGDDIGLRKLARLAADRATSEARLDLTKERRVEVDLLVVRAIERSHRRLRQSACRPGGARKHDQRRRPIRSLKKLRPAVFGLSENRRNELTRLIGGSAGLVRTGWWSLGRLTAA